MVTPEKRSVFLVGPHPVARYGFVQAINSEPGLVVCGEASEIPAGEASTLLRAEALLLDHPAHAHLPLADLERLRSHFPALRVAVLLDQVELRPAVALLRAGVHGIIAKTVGLHELIAALRKVLGGHLFLPAALGEQLIAQIVRGEDALQKATPEDRLTHREREVLQRIGRGETTRDIAQAFGVSARTIETHRRHVKEKLGFGTTAELVRHALAQALGKPAGG